MTTNRHRWLATGMLVSLAACAGCATTSPKNGQWLNLPSPWATIKASKATAAESTSRSTAAKSDAKPAAKKEASDDAIALELARGRNFERSGELDKARKVYEGLREKYPENVAVTHRLGVVADAQRRHGEAEQLFLYALQREPRNAELLSDMGYCYFLQGQLTKSESALSKAVAIDPANSRYRNNLGLVVGHLGRHEEALRHFRQAGTEADAYYNLAFVFAAQERVDEAKECFQVALAADPGHRQARESLASFEEYERMPKHRQEALIAYGERLVPYMEGEAGASLSDDEVQPAAAETVVTSRDASRTTRMLHQRSRGMLGRNMQSERSDEVAAAGHAE